jgi:DNA-binding transcriptional LysR family regulator
MAAMDPEHLLDGRLKIRHLVLATTIAKQGSIVRAAEALHVTQPVVTRGLHELEAMLGVELFERRPRGVTPTIYGTAFLEDATAVLGRLRHAGRQLDLLKRAELGTVTVGTHLAGSNLLLPRAIASLKREHPRLTVVVHEATPDVLRSALLAGEIDMTVGRLSPDTANEGSLSPEQLYLEPIRLVARVGHPVHTDGRHALRELVDYPWVLPGPQTRLRAELEELFFQSGLPLPVDRVECTSMLTLRHLLVSTDVIAALPLLIGRDDDALVLLPTRLRSVSTSVGVVLPSDRPHSAAAQALLAHLRTEAAAIRTSLTEDRTRSSDAPAPPTERVAPSPASP